jgi:hypothetical protein
MLDNRKLFFMKEIDVHCEKNKDIVYTKEYSKKQCELLNKDYGHNVYFYPNGIHIEWEKVKISKTESYNCLYTISPLSYEDHVIKALSIWLPNPTFIWDMWDHTILFWEFEKEVKTDISKFINYINALINDSDDYNTPLYIMMPWFINKKINKQTKIIWNIGGSYSEIKPTIINYLKINDFQSLYTYYVELNSLYQKAQKTFKNVIDVTILSLTYDTLIKELEIKENIIYNKEKNFINVPLLSKNKIMWTTITMLSMYFKNNTLDIDNFLEDKFNIRVFNTVDVNKTLSYWSIEVLFGEDGASILKKNAKNESKAKKIIHWSIKILWFAMTNKDIRNFTYSTPYKLYVIEHEWEQKLMYSETNLKVFNNSHASQWLSFVGNETELLEFFQLLRNTIEEEYYVINQSGNNDIYFWVWNKINIKNSSLPIVKALFLPEYIDTWLKQTSIKDFYSKATKLWKKSKISLALLWTIALSWMDRWKKNKFNIMPFIFINGVSKAGKSEMMQVCKSFAWYNDTRLYMLNWITRQVLQTEASDPAILFLDEFTKIQDPQIENILRNIANWWRAARWTLWANVSYDLSAPIFVTGENIPSSDSVINRTIFIDLDTLDRVPNEFAVQMLDQIRSLTCFEEIANFYDTIDPIFIHKIFKQKKDLLIKSWKDSRAADVWAYILLFNEIFNLEEEHNIILYIEENTKYISNQKGFENAFEALKDHIVQAIFARGATWKQSIENYSTILDIHFSQQYFSSHVVTIQKYAEQCIAEWYDILVSTNKLRLSCADAPVWFNTDTFSEERTEQSKQIKLFIEDTGKLLTWRRFIDDA